MLNLCEPDIYRIYLDANNIYRPSCLQILDSILVKRSRVFCCRHWQDIFIPVPGRFVSKITLGCVILEHYACMRSLLDTCAREHTNIRVSVHSIHQILAFALLIKTAEIECSFTQQEKKETKLYKHSTNTCSCVNNN